mgnify:CR=1 FL=1
MNDRSSAEYYPRVPPRQGEIGHIWKSSVGGYETVKVSKLYADATNGEARDRARNPADGVNAAGDEVSY